MASAFWKPEKSRWVSGLLNLILPGAGLLYLRKPFLAILNFAVAMFLVLTITQGFPVPINDPWGPFKVLMTFVISGMFAFYYANDV
jgi:hypothetical protein